MKLLSSLTVALLLGWVPMLLGDDWPRFRGEGGLGFGVGANIPTSLSEAAALWHIPLKGQGHSSPVVVGKKLFYTVTPQTSPDHRDVVCISTEDGRELWRKSFGFSEYVLHQFNSSSSTSPTADEKRVYVWWNDGEKSEVFALDHNGESVWKEALGSFESAHGCGSSVALADGVLIVQKENLSAESCIFGLDAATGKSLWKTPVPVKKIKKTPYVTPVIRAADKGKEAIFVSPDNGMFSLDTKTGVFRWKFDPKFAHRCVASPVLVGDYIFASCGGGGGGKDSVVIQVPSGTDKVTEIYRLSKQLPYVPTGLGMDGRLFLVNDGGVGTCYDVKSGDQLWRERLLGKCFASQIAIGGNIYAFGRDGDYKVFKAAAAYEQVAEGNLGAGIHATPAVGDGKLFVRTDEKLLCFQNGPDA